MPGAGDLPAGEFSAILDSPDTDFPLFAPPSEPVSDTKYAIGLHAAGLIKDGGSLQIGIGQVGDALAQGLILRLAFVVALRLGGGGRRRRAGRARAAVPRCGRRPRSLSDLALPLAAALGTWFLVRGVRRAPSDPATAGVTGFVAAMTAATAAAGFALLGNPYALLLVVPARHAPRAPARFGVVVRLGVVALGLAGVALVVGLVAGPGDLGAETPARIARAIADGSLSAGVVVGLVLLLAAAAQLVAIVSGLTARLLRAGDDASRGLA